MATRKAKTLEAADIKTLIERVSRETKRPVVEKVAFLLSYYAGLRVQEIAGLRWVSVLDHHGNMDTSTFRDATGKAVKRHMLFVGSDIGKYGKERSIAMHPDLVAGLLELRALGLPGDFIVPSAQRGASQSLKARAHALKMRINRFYDRIGFEGCSSHSGRRSFITDRARKANFVGCSLVDVQKMAGHAQLTTTQEYIDVTANQASLAMLDF